MLNAVEVFCHFKLDQIQAYLFIEFTTTQKESMGLVGHILFKTLQNWKL